ncbi:MAG: hypothetical protein MJ099_06585, partial [Clostridia bacterium]|nr:hypothetical protein [Clostridia bacterium]
MKKLLAAFACLLALMLCVCACAEGHTGEMKLEELVIEAVYTVEPVETEDPEAAAPAIKTAAEDPAVISDYVITPDGYLVLTLEDEKLYAVGIMSAFVAEDQIGENDSVEIDEVTYALLSGCEEKENGDFVVTLNADETEYLLGTMAQPGDSYVAKVSRKKAAAEEEVTTETATLNTTYIDKDSGDVIKTVSETWTNSSNGDFSYVSETVDYVNDGYTTREEVSSVTNA